MFAYGMVCFIGVGFAGRRHLTAALNLDCKVNLSVLDLRVLGN